MDFKTINNFKKELLKDLKRWEGKPLAFMGEMAELMEKVKESFYGI